MYFIDVVVFASQIHYQQLLFLLSYFLQVLICKHKTIFFFCYFNKIERLATFDLALIQKRPNENCTQHSTINLKLIQIPTSQIVYFWNRLFSSAYIRLPLPRSIRQFL